MPAPTPEERHSSRVSTGTSSPWPQVSECHHPGNSLPTEWSVPPIPVSPVWREGSCGAPDGQRSDWLGRGRELGKGGVSGPGRRKQGLPQKRTGTIFEVKRMEAAVGTPDHGPRGTEPLGPPRLCISRTLVEVPRTRRRGGHWTLGPRSVTPGQNGPHSDRNGLPLVHSPSVGRSVSPRRAKCGVCSAVL